MTACNSVRIDQTNARTYFVNDIKSGRTAAISINEHVGGAVVHIPAFGCPNLLELFNRTENPKAHR